jgi:hypothetical protein
MTRIAAQAVLICALFAPLSQAAGQNAGGKQIMATRSVVAYQELEASLEDAARRGDRDALSRLLGADFECRTGQTTLGRDEWMEKQAGAAAIPRDLSVREFPGFSVVTFVLDTRGGRDRNSPVYFVVDIWNSESRRLEMRNADEMRKPPAATMRPTGRE